MGGVEMVATFVQHNFAFKEYHYGCIIKEPLRITPEFISLEKKVYIGHHARIEGVSEWNGRKFSPSIRFCEGSSVQQNLHLTCANSIVIGKYTAIAANVTITDIHHPYTDILTPIEQQMIEVKEVEIGEDCKIYNNAVILPGVHIGKHVTVGANSVVTKDIPDYSVVVGNPARVIKTFDFKINKWVKK